MGERRVSVTGVEVAISWYLLYLLIEKKRLLGPQTPTPPSPHPHLSPLEYPITGQIGEKLKGPRLNPGHDLGWESPGVYLATVVQHKPPQPVSSPLSAPARWPLPGVPLRGRRSGITLRGAPVLWRPLIYSPPFFLLLHREGASQTGSCTRACPVGFFKLRRGKKRGFCAKCMLRGCSECTTRHYCSICKAGLVRHAGRCRKKCPFGTEISPRTPGLCLSSPTPPTDLDNEIIKINRTWATTKTATTTIQPISNATSTSSLPPDRPPKRKRKKKRKKGRKNKKRHRRRKHKKNRLRNRRRKEMRRRRLRQQKERRRKKMSNREARVTFSLAPH
ncbi:hypothetical protein O3P69_004775 [Scylla paramamosain]|uniref:R-spondin Fu-CRD domain-containing protein n=1 Tax=Scylla paramamosain TaxID=85552 RepID=A0AAW0UD82_SCYPA